MESDARRAAVTSETGARGRPADKAIHDISHGHSFVNAPLVRVLLEQQAQSRERRFAGVIPSRQLILNEGAQSLRHQRGWSGDGIKGLVVCPDDRRHYCKLSAVDTLLVSC